MDVAPDPGRDKASAGQPTWCGTITAKPGMFATSIAMKIESWEKDGWNLLIDAALRTCELPPDPVRARAAAIIEQHWINLTGMSERAAAYSLAARLDTANFAAARKRLCDALKISDEAGLDDRVAMDARRKLFGCNAQAPLWSERDDMEPELLGFLDQNTGDTDELVRLAYVATRARIADYAQNRDFEQQLVGYAIDRIDYEALSDDKIMKALEAEPYRGNVYAQAAARETLGRVRLSIAKIDREVKKRTSDAGWKELLVDAPKRGVDAYTAGASKHGDAIARSNAFEHAALGPSKKAIAGCGPQLRKDFVTVWKSLPHESTDAATASLSDPVASLLLSRLVACMAMDGDTMLATKLAGVASGLRVGRGPRFAAYYATLEAAGTIHGDRERFPITPESLKRLVTITRILDDVATAAAAKRPAHDATGFAGNGGKGLIEKLTKQAHGVAITFATEKHQEMSQSCTATNRILRIAENGTVEYYLKCHDTGLVWVDTTPEPVFVPTEYGDNFAVGQLMKFEATRGRGDQRWALPIWVFADKAKSKLVNFYGFGF